MGLTYEGVWADMSDGHGRNLSIPQPPLAQARAMEPQTVPSDGKVAIAWEVWRPRIPLALIVIGTVGVFAGLLAQNCLILPLTEGGECRSGPFDLLGAYAVAGFLLMLAAGLYLVFFRGDETFTHTCWSCGRTYKDHSRLSERRSYGHPVCSAECEERVNHANRIEEERERIRTLEALAVRASTEVARARATERLAEIAATEGGPLGALAQEALARLAQGQA